MQRRGLLFATVGAIATAIIPTLASAKPSALDRVRTPCLTSLIKKKIVSLCEDFIFEPNDEITRAEIEKTISGYLEDIRRRKGIYDFCVSTDATTVADVERGIIRVDVSFQRTDSFTHVPIRITTGIVP